MLKVFMKIPGVSRPLAVVGHMVFEDERYLVIIQDVIRKKILWENILYIEEIPVAPGMVKDSDLVTAEATSQEQGIRAPSVTSAPSKQPAPGNGLTNITVAFTGELNRLFTIEGVDASLISKSQWSPDLAKLIFTNPEIKTVLGSFIIKDIAINGPNITITTASEKRDAAVADMQTKLNLVTKLAGATAKFNAQQTGRPSMRLPTDFSMASSPFDRPISLTGAYDGGEEVDVSYREEKDSGEAGA